jgi:aspartyl-tRNA(Asn)/glutamyl-tRNA(Gln) amidotransferase subunit A
MRTAYELSRAIRQREVSAEQVVGECLAAIGQRDPTIQAFLWVNEQGALEAARRIDRRIAAGEAVGLLAGLPIAVKDNMCTRGGRTTCGSKILGNFESPYNAHVIDQLDRAGAVLVGKCNMDEFAMGSSTENSAFAQTRNPWDNGKVPGGSSGGSAAAVAARMVPVSLGSDTGGSIRQPASFCGITGLKPTYGRVSRFGLVAYGSSLDQIGPFGVDARDTALVLQAIAGHDMRDSTSASEPVPDYLKELERLDLPLRVGIAAEYFGEGLDPQVKAAVLAAIEVLKGRGAEIVEVHLPHLKYAVATYYIVATAEASSNLARYDGVHYGYRTAEPKDYIDMYCGSRQEGFGQEVKRRIMLGTFTLSSGYYDAYYLKALKVRTLIKRDFEQAFEKCDVIVSPTAPSPAWSLGQMTADPLAMYLADIYTISANLAGIPGISVPCGFSAEGLPIGMQMMGRHFAEGRLLQVAWAYQRETQWHAKAPQVATASSGNGGPGDRVAR